MDGFNSTFFDNPSSATNEDIFNELENGTDSKISKETKNLLTQGDKILSHMEKLVKKDPEEYGEKYSAMVREREELQTITVKAFCDDKKITLDELGDLKKEFDDVHKLSERKRDKIKRFKDHVFNEIDEEIIEKTERGVKHIGNEIEEESIKIKDGVKDFIDNEKKIDRGKKIKDYTTVTEAYDALKHTQKKYSLENAWGPAENTNRIKEIQSNNERDAFHLRLIEHIFKLSPELEQQKTSIYSKENGYKLIDKQGYEENFSKQDINKVGPESLSLYIDFLKKEYGDEAQTMFLRNIKLETLEDGTENSDIIEDFLDTGSKILAGYNKFRSAKKTKMILEDGISRIQDPLLKEYIQDEIDKLGNINARSWDEKDWSLLLLSVVLKNNGDKRIALALALDTHQNTQKSIINRLSSESGGKYIIAHTEELSYYPIKTKDYKDRIESEDINILNPLALANYLDHLDKNEGINEIFKYLSYDKLEIIQKQLQDNNEATKILKRRRLGYITEIITDFSPTSKLNMVENIKNLKSRNSQEAALAYIDKNIQYLTIKLGKDIISHIRKENKNATEEEIINRSEVVMESITVLIASNADIETVIKAIDNTGLNIELKPTTEQIKAIQTQKEAKKLAQAKIRERRIKKSGSPEEREAAKRNTEAAEKNLQQSQKSQFIATNIDKDNYAKIARGDKTVDEVVEEMKERDDDFANEMKKYEIPEELKLPESETIETEFMQAFSSEKIAGTYTIETPEGEKIEGLTDVEFREVSKNKEARDNLVDMKHTCEDCGLDYFWEDRHIIFTAIGNMNTLGFNISDGNYINSAELKFILATIVSSIGDELGEENKEKVASLKSTGSLGEAINIVKDINGTAGTLVTEDAVFKGRGNLKGYSSIERKFRDKFYSENSSQVFNHSRFQESLTS